MLKDHITESDQNVSDMSNSRKLCILAASLNNFGVRLLESGRRSEAVEIFSLALETLQEIVHQQQAVDTQFDESTSMVERGERDMLTGEKVLHENGSSTTQISSMRILPNRSSGLQRRSTTLASHPALAEAEHETPVEAVISPAWNEREKVNSLFNQPFHIGALEAATRNIEDHDFTQDSATILYNLALALQSERRNLRKALTIFKMASLLVAGAEFVTDQVESASDLAVINWSSSGILHMSILNNICQIHNDMGEYIEARHALDDLVAIINKADQNGIITKWSVLFLQELMSTPCAASAA